LRRLPQPICVYPVPKLYEPHQPSLALMRCVAAYTYRVAISN